MTPKEFLSSKPEQIIIVANGTNGSGHAAIVDREHNLAVLLHKIGMTSDDLFAGDIVTFDTETYKVAGETCHPIIGGRARLGEP